MEGVKNMKHIIPRRSKEALSLESSEIRSVFRGIFFNCDYPRTGFRLVLTDY